MVLSLKYPDFVKLQKKLNQNVHGMFARNSGYKIGIFNGPGGSINKAILR